MTIPTSPTPIVGDIAAASEVTINTKGGSVTATLKKTLRAQLGDVTNQLAGAALQFSTGQSVVLLANAARMETAPVRVRKVGRNRFEIELEAGGEEEIDEVTAAFLRLKKDQFEKGLLDLSEPMSAEDLRKRSDADFAEIQARIEKAGLKYPPVI